MRYSSSVYYACTGAAPVLLPLATSRGLLWGAGMAHLVETLDVGGLGETRVAWWALLTVNYIPRRSVGRARGGPGGIRSGRGQGAEREQGRDGLNINCKLCPVCNQGSSLARKYYYTRGYTV